MTNALKQLIKIGFEYLGYDVIWIKHLKQNIASQKVIEKTPFIWIKTEKTRVQKRGYTLDDDLLIYELTKERYHGYQ
jgi:RimJ/RimL family protein N-acetyltransferase